MEIKVKDVYEVAVGLKVATFEKPNENIVGLDHYNFKDMIFLKKETIENLIPIFKKVIDKRSRKRYTKNRNKQRKGN